MDGFRNIILGRVLLKEDASTGDDVVVTRTERLDNTIIPGDELFFDSLHATTAVDAILVEPSDTNLPDSIEHQEEVEIDPSTFDPATRTGNIQLSAAITNDYTVANGAYIRLKTLPSTIADLKFIQNDFIPIMNTAPLDEWFPGVLVVNRGLYQTDDAGSVIYDFRYGIRVYVCDVLRADQDNTRLLIERAETVRDMILEDNYIGGTVHQCEFDRMLPWFSTDLAQTNKKFITMTHGLEVGWVQIDFTVRRNEIWNKMYST